MRFFVGVPEPAWACHFDACFISLNRTRRRAGPFEVDEWIADSGAFTEVSRHGGYRRSVREHASEIRRQKGNGRLLAAVAEDWMCEPKTLRKTGKSVREHQRLTLERYDDLLACDTGGVYILPVLQGWTPGDYVDHLEEYGDRLAPGAWVGVGSVCKRSNLISIWRVLDGIKTVRPDLRLHGFGVKTEGLGYAPIRELLETADSMAWSFSARMQGRNQNDWHEAKQFALTMGGAA